MLEIVAMAGGTEKVLWRASEHFAKGDAHMAAHFVDWAVDAAPDSKDAHAVRGKV